MLTLSFSTIKAAKEVADRICKLLEEKAEINMIFAAAPSQDEFLNHLIHDKRIDWTRINAFHMDEYIGIHPDAPQSFGHFLRIRIFDKVPFKKVNYLNGRAESLEEECKRYADLLTKSRIKLMRYIEPFTVKFQKNVQQVYCEEKKNLRYIWTPKVQNR